MINLRLGSHESGSPDCEGRSCAFPERKAHHAYCLGRFKLHMSILASPVRKELDVGILGNRECDEVRRPSKSRVFNPGWCMAIVQRHFHCDEGAEACACVVMNAKGVRKSACLLAEKFTSFLVPACDVVAIGDEKTIADLGVRNKGCRSSYGVPTGDHLDVQRLKRRLRDAERHVYAA